MPEYPCHRSASVETPSRLGRPRRIVRRIVPLLACACVCIGFDLGGSPGRAADKAPRFLAVLAGGERLQSNVLTDWQTVSSTPRLDGKTLFDAARPLRWLRDRALPPATTPRAYVETAGGDRLPGVVVGYRDGQENPYSPTPACFVVKPEFALQPPQNIVEPRIRVAAHHVRRLVWQRRENDRLQPGTLFYRDGRSVAYRAIRFSDGLASLLTADGQRKVYFAEIAEIHLPTPDAWNLHFEELATLCPSGQGRLLQLETSDGLIAMTSLERLATSGSANPNDFGRWVHGVQPAWSLDILWVPTGGVTMRRSFTVHEAPLSRIWPSESQQRSLLAGVGPPWQLNRNVQGGPLRSGAADEFGWGFGVHAASELHFALPSCVRSFSASAGLDRIAGTGGCVRVRVLADDPKSKPLYESPPIVGSTKVEKIAAVPLAGRQRLILQVDPAHDGRPAGADPLDIRDMTDWFEPMLELDADAVRQEIARRAPLLVLAWSGWTFSLDRLGETTGDPAHDGAVEWFNVRDENSPAPGTFRLACLAKNRPLTLEREVTVGPESHWLALLAYQPINTGQTTKIEMRVDGETVQELASPVFPRGVAEPPPMLLSLRDYQGRTLRLQLVQSPPAAPSPIVWRFVRLTEQLPTLHQALEDDASLESVAGSPSPAPDAAAALQEDDRYHGVRAIRLTTGQQVRMSLQRPVPIREIPQLDEFRYVHYAVRKGKGGLFAIEFQDASGRDRPMRVDGGVGPPAYGAALRLWSDPNSEQWITITRDLFGDFGKSDVAGLTFSCVAGEFSTFDSIYFGRSRDDFALIPRVVQAPKVGEKQRRELVQPAVERIGPAVVALTFQDGRRGSGVQIDVNNVLTAGHLLGALDQKVEVRLGDGKTATGTVRGVCRDLDVGLLRIDPPYGRFCTAVAMAATPEKMLYIAATHRRSPVDAEAPRTEVVEIRRLFRNMIWTDFEPAEWTVGGPLLDQYARTVGVNVRRDPAGGLVYARLTELLPLLPRLQKGEWFGQWAPGTQPDAGWTVRWESTGCNATGVAGDSPAAKAGLAEGDRLLRIGDRLLLGPDDLQAALGDKNPGDELTVEYRRGAERKSTKLKLAPRTP